MLERAQAAGLVFHHQSGATGGFTYPEIMCGGVCLADLDGDHDLDVYLPQGGKIPGSPDQRVGDDTTQTSSANRLFLNDGKGNFQDASGNQGVGHRGYGMGAFAADVDGDHDLDLLLTNTGPLALLINEGDATFTDCSITSGIPQHDGLWMNASFGDFDGDSKLDVYVANYTAWSYDAAPHCDSPSGLPDYCDPSNFAGAADRLLLGNGDGTFRDVTESSGIGRVASRSMGVVALDVDADHDLDIYVACDGEENLLWINQGDGTFQEEAMTRGAALNAHGAPEASMGIACADIDGDGDEDLIISHLTQETHTVYRNDSGFFVDITAASGVGRWSRPDTGFGIGLIDFDNDQNLDLLIVNGSVARPTRPDDPDHPYAQPDRLARGMPGGRFPTATLITGMQTADAHDVSVSRGAAFGDLDGDGLVDAVVVIKDGPARLLQNATLTDTAWIGVRPVTIEEGPAVIGTSVEIVEIPNLGLRMVRPHGSYLASSEDIVRFGLGTRASPVTAVTTWPDGVREQFSNLELGKVHRLVRGTGSSSPTVETMAPPSETSRRMARVESSPSRQGRLSVPSPDASGSKVASGTELGPYPPLSLEQLGKRSQRPMLDQAALDQWCRDAGLPAPPQVSALDAPTWKLVHTAIEAAGRSPSADNLAKLAMFYDGHRSEESALALYARVVELEPDQPRWWHLLGRVQLNQGLASEAVESLTRAVELLPRPGTVARLAAAQLASGNAGEAIRNWQRYIETRPRDPYGYTRLAQATETTGQFQQALEAAEKALQQNPRARAALVIASRAAARLGDQRRASAFAARASALTKADDPVLFDEFENEMYAHAKPVDYLVQAAIQYKQKGDFPKAFAAAQLLAERRPEEAQNWQLLLWLSTVTRNPRAPEYAAIAVELDPAFAPGWETLAQVKLKASDWQGALAAAEKAVAADPDFAPAQLSRGLALGKLERYEEALEVLEISISANPNDLLALQMKSACLLSLGRREEARESVNRMLAMDPDHPWRGVFSTSSSNLGSPEAPLHGAPAGGLCSSPSKYAGLSKKNARRSQTAQLKSVFVVLCTCFTARGAAADSFRICSYLRNIPEKSLTRQISRLVWPIEPRRCRHFDEK